MLHKLHPLLVQEEEESVCRGLRQEEIVVLCYGRRHTPSALSKYQQWDMTKESCYCSMVSQKCRTRRAAMTGWSCDLPSSEAETGTLQAEMLSWGIKGSILLEEVFLGSTDYSRVWKLRKIYLLCMMVLPTYKCSVNQQEYLCCLISFYIKDSPWLGIHICGCLY